MGNALMPLRCESAVFSRQWSENRKGKRPCAEIGRSLSVADVQMSLKSPPMAFQCGPFSTAARTVSGLGSIRVLKLTVEGIV